MRAFLKRNTKRLIRILICLRRINWWQFLRLYKTNGDIVLITPLWAKNWIIHHLELDLLLVGAIVKQGRTFRIFTGKHYNTIRNKMVFYNASEIFNDTGSVNYSEFLVSWCRALEANGNKVLLGSHEIAYWENKAYMYRKFKELGIRHPETQIFNSIEELQQATVHYPCLIKEEHSYGSLGVHKVNSREEAIALCSTEKFKKRNEHIIVQQLVDMHKDFRVIIVGDEIVLHYWRTNPAKEWKPTSTMHGSNVDFVTFPEQWRDYILQTFKKLNLTTGAFDITWQGDDLTTEPIILEVSPSYQPNPPVDLTGRGFTYGEFKKKFLWRNSWDTIYLHWVQLLMEKRIKWFLKDK